MTKTGIYFFIGMCLLASCSDDTGESSNEELAEAEEHNSEEDISITENGCVGSYSGPEFFEGSDVAHQLSNHVSEEVGNELKNLYEAGNWSKVDLQSISMTTKGMDQKGDVTYMLDIPFVKTDYACDAMTAFDHRGGWGHEITKASVLEIFGSMKKMEIVEKNTPEGLQEFWVQWQHKDYQSSCK